MSLSRPGRKYFWHLGVAAISLLSAILFFTAVSQTSIDIPIRGDARDYFAYAYNLKTYGIYSRSWPGTSAEAPAPDAMRAPGYPFLISLLLKQDEPSATLTSVLYLQASMGVLTVMAYLYLYRRFMPAGWALAAGLLTAISPHLVNASVYLLTESLFTLLLGVHLLLLERALRLKHAPWAILAGVFLAFTFLVRPTTQYLLFAYCAAMLFWAGSRWREYGKLLLWLLLPAAIATMGWSARNLAETGRMSDPALTTSFLHHGMYINMMYEDRPETYGYPYRFDPNTGEIAGNIGKVLGAIWQHYKDHPARYTAWILIGKPAQFFSWNLTESVGDAFIYAPLRSPYFENRLFQFTHTLAQSLHPFLILLSLVGAYLSVRGGLGNVSAALLGLVLIYFVVLHMIGAPFPRYSVPLRPINYGLAVYALHVGLRSWLERSK